MITRPRNTNKTAGVGIGGGAAMPSRRRLLPPLRLLLLLLVLRQAPGLGATVEDVNEDDNTTASPTASPAIVGSIAGEACAGGLGQFTLVFRQTAGFYLSPASAWLSHNPESPGEPNFSVLGTLEPNFRLAEHLPAGSGKFEFKMQWPGDADANGTNHWRQSSNPATSTVVGVTGYEALAISYNGAGWIGLENSRNQVNAASGTTPLMDGNAGLNFGYSIGAVIAITQVADLLSGILETGIRGPVIDSTHTILVNRTELYACLVTLPSPTVSPSVSPSVSMTAVSPSMPPTFVSPDAPCEDDPLHIMRGDTMALCAALIAGGGDDGDCDASYRADGGGYIPPRYSTVMDNGRFARPATTVDMCGITADSAFAVDGWHHVNDPALTNAELGGCLLVQASTSVVGVPSGLGIPSGPGSSIGWIGDGTDSVPPQAYRLVGNCGTIAPGLLAAQSMYGGIEQTVMLVPGRTYRVAWSMSTGPHAIGSYTVGTVRLSVVHNAADGTRRTPIANVTYTTSAEIVNADSTPNWESFEATFNVSTAEGPGGVPAPTAYTVRFDVGWTSDVLDNGCVNIAAVVVDEQWSGWNTSVAGLCPARCGRCIATLNDTGQWDPPTCDPVDVQCAGHSADAPDVCAAMSGRCGGADHTGPTECDAESYCALGNREHKECLPLSDLDMWADCNATVDCDGRMWCWRTSSGDATTGVCKPSGLCRGQSAVQPNIDGNLPPPTTQALLNAAVMASTNPDSNAAAAAQADFDTLNFGEVDPLIDLALAQNATVRIATSTYAISVFTLQPSDDIEAEWTPHASVNPSNASSCVIAELDDRDGCNGGCRVARAFYNSPTADLAGTAVVDQDFAVDGPVFSLWLVSLASADTVGLASVNFTIAMTRVGAADFRCAQYSTVAAGWTSAGCTQQAAGIIVDCQCRASGPVAGPNRVRRGIGSGASYFTVLVGDSRENGARSPSEAAHADGLLWVTYIGLVFSVPSMLAFVFLYARHEELRNQHRFNIANLCAALATAMLLFVFGINGEPGTAGCTATAFLLQWTLLIAVSWMLLDGWFQYRTFVRVFKAHRSAPNLGRKAAVAYLVPLALCTVSFAVWEDDYGFAVAAAGPAGNGTTPAGSAYAVCFIDQKSDARLVFFVPLVAMLVLNLVFFAAVMHVVVTAPVARSARKKMIPPRSRRALKASLMFLPTMGLSWGFGIVAAELDDTEARLVFTWLFTVMMVVQGVIIFWFHLYQDREIRRKLNLGRFFLVDHRVKPKVQRKRHRHDRGWFNQTPAGGTPADSSTIGSSVAVTGDLMRSGGPPPAYTPAPQFDGPPRSPSAGSVGPLIRVRSSSLPTIELDMSADCSLASLSGSPMSQEPRRRASMQLPASPPGDHGGGAAVVPVVLRRQKLATTADVLPYSSRAGEYITAYQRDSAQPDSELCRSNSDDDDDDDNAENVGNATAWRRSVGPETEMLNGLPASPWFDGGPEMDDQSIGAGSVRGVPASGASWMPIAAHTALAGQFDGARNYTVTLRSGNEGGGRSFGLGTAAAAAAPRYRAETVWSDEEPDSIRMRNLQPPGGASRASITSMGVEGGRGVPGLLDQASSISPLPPRAAAIAAGAAPDERSRKATLWDVVVSTDPKEEPRDGAVSADSLIAGRETAPRRISLV